MNIRKRLPNRRPAHTETLLIDGQVSTATVGFDPESGQPPELFLTAGQVGSLRDARPSPVPVAVSRAR